MYTCAKFTFWTVFLRENRKECPSDKDTIRAHQSCHPCIQLFDQLLHQLLNRIIPFDIFHYFISDFTTVIPALVSVKMLLGNIFDGWFNFKFKHFFSGCRFISLWILVSRFTLWSRGYDVVGLRVWAFVIGRSKKINFKTGKANHEWFVTETHYIKPTRPKGQARDHNSQWEYRHRGYNDTLSRLR